MTTAQTQHTHSGTQLLSHYKAASGAVLVETREEGRQLAELLDEFPREALIATAFGLVVAIPCHVAFDYLASRVRAFAHDMERSAADIVDVLTEAGEHE